MRFDIDADERSVSFAVPRKIYSEESLKIAAHIFSAKAEVFLEDSAAEFDLTLKSKRIGSTQGDLEKLGGEFLNELLNQEYRFIVGRFNQKISSLIVTQTLLAARGGEEPPKRPEGEEAPEFKTAVAQMMKDAADEINRTMPKKISPQGTPLPPAQEDALA